MDVDDGSGRTQTAWQERRRSAAFRSQTGTWSAVGLFLCLTGGALAVAKAAQGSRHAPGLDAALWVVAFVVLGILVVLAARILDAIHLHDDRR